MPVDVLRTVSASIPIANRDPFVNSAIAVGQYKPAEVPRIGLKRLLTLFLLVLPNECGTRCSDDAVGLELLRDRRTAPSRPVQRARRAQGAPLATYEKTRPAKEGKKTNLLEQQREDPHRGAARRAPSNDSSNGSGRTLRGLRMTSEFDVALNAVAVQLNGASLATIRSAPQVLYAEYQGLSAPQRTTTRTFDLSMPFRRGNWRRARSAPATASRSRSSTPASTYGIPASATPGCPEGNLHRTTSSSTAARTTKSSMQRPSTTSSQNPASARPTRTVTARTSPAPLPATRARPRRSTTVERARRYPSRPSGRHPGAILGNFNVFPGTLASARSGGHPERLAACVSSWVRRRQHEPGQQIQRRARPPLAGRRPVRPRRNGWRNRRRQYRPGRRKQMRMRGFAPRAITAGASSVGRFVGAPVATSRRGRLRSSIEQPRL